MPRDLLADIPPPRDLLEGERREPRDLLQKGQMADREGRWRRGDLAPIERNLDTGEWKWAIPNVVHGLIDAIQLPGEVMRGEVDPMSEEGFDRTMGLGMLMTGAGGVRGAATRPRPPRMTPMERNRLEYGLPGTPVREPAIREAERAVRGSVEQTNRAGNINLDRIFAPEDVKAALGQVAREHGGFADARRGVVSHEQTRELAALVGMDARKLGRRKTGVALNAEEMFAARELLVAQANKVRDAAKLAETGTDLQKAKFQEEMTRLVAIQEQVAGATAEAGRALQQFRMLAGASKDDIAALARIGADSGTDSATMARLVNGMDDPAQIASFVRNAMKAKTSDMLLEAWINGLLSGPQTHAVNTLSNALVSVWSIPEAAVAATISKATGSGIVGREVLSRTLGFLEGTKDGLRAAARSFRTEEPLYETSKLDTARKHQAIPGRIGKVVRIPGRALTAEDAFFKSIAYRQEINALAVRHATAEGLKGRALASRIAELRSNPTEGMQAAARQFATKQTFTNPLGAKGQTTLGLLRQTPALRVVLPFFRTPVNLIKFAAERTPAAVLMKEARDNLMGRNGAVARDQQLARTALGSAVGGVAVYEALAGNITGGGPTDPSERTLMYADGWQPYSVRVGDTYYAYGRLEPLGQLLGIAADMAELGSAATDKELEDIGWLVSASIAKNLTSKTWLQGPAELVEALSDPDRYGPSYIQKLVGTIIPTGMAQLARTQDPYLREARSVLDRVRERIPGAREALLHRRDVFGEPIKREGGVGPDLVSPIYQSMARNDPTIKEMLDLGVHPGALRRSIRGVSLNDDEYDFLSQAAGQLMKQGLDVLRSSPDWAELPEDVRSTAMGDVVRKSRDIARTATLKRFPELAMRISSMKRVKKGAK